jgi:lipid-binding SYLF domain-containing protein
MVNNPLPTDLAGECKKASKILNSFIDPVHAGGIDSVVPPNILKNAKGFAIYTVLKAGFVWSGRAGSGLVVARLPDGSWSAPSCIATAGVVSILFLTFIYVLTLFFLGSRWTNWSTVN